MRSITVFLIAAVLAVPAFAQVDLTDPQAKLMACLKAAQPGHVSQAADELLCEATFNRLLDDLKGQICLPASYDRRAGLRAMVSNMIQNAKDPVMALPLEITMERFARADPLFKCR